MGYVIICAVDESGSLHDTRVQGRPAWNEDQGNDGSGEVMFNPAIPAIITVINGEVIKRRAAMNKDTDYTDMIICPHCGDEGNEIGEINQGDDGEQYEIECNECGKEFTVRIYVSVRYTTEKG